MNDLWRKLAPISDEAWQAIDEEARNHLKVTLAARRLVDFNGPLGWAVSAVETGQVQALSSSPGTVNAALRKVQCLVELRLPFELSRREIDALARGSRDADLDPVRTAATAIGTCEDKIIFHGYPEAGIEGIFQASAASALKLPENCARLPAVISEALARLLANGVSGPYALALGPQAYAAVTGSTTEAGYPVLQHVQRLVNGPVFWAPGVQGALLCSTRGGDFELSVGRDLSIGYHDHNATKVQLYIEESLTFRVFSPQAAIPLVHE